MHTGAELDVDVIDANHDSVELGQGVRLDNIHEMRFPFSQILMGAEMRLKITTKQNTEIPASQPKARVGE